MAYTRLEPKSSHMTKYFQLLELVLLNIIKANIKCNKGSHYPHLLNNYLFNYLNFSGLTSSSIIDISNSCCILVENSLHKKRLVDPKTI